MTETQDERIARLRRERELNLEFCVCVISEDGEVLSLCEAHNDFVDQLRDENRRLRELLGE